MNSNCHLKTCILCTLSNSATPLEGIGRAKADLMILTLYPSSNEDKYRKHFPFTEGELLENMLNSIGLSSKHFYITTILKCKPEYGINPTKEQFSTCTENHFLKELEEIKPRVILALGSDIGKYINGAKFAITSSRGQYIFNDIPTYITYHPRYLLRFPSLEVNSPKWQAWQDLIKFKDLLDNGLSF